MIVFILIIKVVCFSLLPYPHSHFISSTLEPYGSCAVYAFVLVDTVECVPSLCRIGLLMGISDEHFVPLHVR